MQGLINEQLKKIKKESGARAGSFALYMRLLGRLWKLTWRWLRARWTFRGVKEKGRFVFQNGGMRELIDGQLRIGNRVRFWSTIMPVQLRVAPRAKLSIADNCYINGAIIVAHEHISIGEGVYLAPMAHISDSYAFGSPEAEQQTAPVHIGDQAWIATRAIVLPGVRIGEGAVVGVGALVSEDVPARAIVAGVPAKVIRYLDSGEKPGEEIEEVKS